MPIQLDKNRDANQRFLSEYEKRRQANLTPVLDQRGYPTGKYYDPRFQTIAGQPSPARFQAHLLYLKQAGIPVKTNQPVPEGFDPVDMYESQSTGESIKNILKLAVNNSISGGAVTNALFGEDPYDMSHFQPGPIENIAGTLLSFLDPAAMLAMATGAGEAGLAAKEVSALIPKVAGVIASPGGQAAIKGAGALGAYEGVNTGIRTRGDIAETAAAAGKGAVLGATAGVAGVAGRAALPGIAGKIAAPVAEVAAFGTVGPTLEGRKPIWDDYLNAAGVILGMKAAHWGGSWAAKKAASAQLKSVAAEASRVQDRVENDGIPIDQAIQEEVDAISMVEPGKRMFRINSRNRQAVKDLSESFKGRRIVESGGFMAEKDVSSAKEKEQNWIPGHINVTEPFWKGEGFNYQELHSTTENALAGKPITDKQWQTLRRAYKLRGKWGYEEGQNTESKTIHELGLSVGDEVRINGQWHRVLSSDENGVTLKNGEVLDLSPIDELPVDVRPKTRTPIVERSVPAGETNVKPEPTTAELLAQTKADMAAATNQFLDKQEVNMTAEVPGEGKAPAHGIQKSLGLEPSVSPAKQPTVKEPWEMVQQNNDLSGAIGIHKPALNAMVEGYKDPKSVLWDRPIAIRANGEIIEGFHRATAAKIAGVEPPLVVLTEKQVSGLNATEVDQLARKVYRKPAVSPAKQVEGETPEAAAERMGVTFNGMQERPGGKPPYFLFTDPQSNNSTFAATSVADAGIALKNFREKFQAAKAKPSIFDKINLDAIPAKMEAEVEVVDAETGKRGKAKVNARETYKELEKRGDMLQKLLDCLRSG